MTEQKDSTGKELRRPVADRWAIWRAAKAPVARGFILPPEPRSIGMVARGRQLSQGKFALGGALVEAKGESLWSVQSPSLGFDEAAHSFVWLDDLAAAGDGRARTTAQAWVAEWIARFGQGQGDWTPALTGRRLLRLISHGELLTAGAPEAGVSAYFRSLSQQSHYLARRWQIAASGLPRLEALSGLLAAGLLLDGLQSLTTPALDAFVAEAETTVDAEGGIPSRNPDELLDIFTLISWARLELDLAGIKVPEGLTAASTRIAPTLRALRHADGGLARFHGGGRGLEGRLDQALAAAKVRPGQATGLAMGYARLSGGRTTVILDATSPPGGPGEANGHASTLALELTSGRRPMIVSCGSGAPFGAEWRRAGRATASHSTLVIEGVSSSRLGKGERLTERASVMPPRLTKTDEAESLVCGHNGWVQTHGLQHLRALELSHDGRVLLGHDTLAARDKAMTLRLTKLLGQAGPRGVPFSLRFHLHPDVDARLDLGGSAVSLALRSGEIWVFRHDGFGSLSLQPSVYLEKGRLRPRPARQIVLSAHLVADHAELGWTLAKAQDTPLAIRDLDREEPPV